MRSSKNRQRSKQNRPRTLGNIVNRVFDSSGPEGKVRGTPQQIIEKYLILARDAQLSNDRVAAENFLQHAEHYTRLLGEAQRELAAEQEARQSQGGFRRDEREGAEGWGGGQDRREGREGERGGWRDPQGYGNGERREGERGERRDGERGERREGDRWADRREGGREGGRREPRPDMRGEPRPPAAAEVVDLADDPRDSGLVETPESRLVAAPMMPPLPAPEDEAAPAAAETAGRPPRRPRGPRRPRQDGAPQGEAPAVAD